MSKIDTFKALAKSQGFNDADIQSFVSALPPESPEYPGLTVPEVQKFQSTAALQANADDKTLGRTLKLRDMDQQERQKNIENYLGLVTPGSDAETLKTILPTDYYSDVLLAAKNKGIDVKMPETKESTATAPLKGLVKVMGELKTGAQEVGIPQLIGGKLGLSSDLQRFEQKKLLAGQFLAKLVEKNRLSDQDRQFYQNKIMNLSPIGIQKVKEETIDSLTKDILNLAGYNPEDFGITSQNKGLPSTPPTLGGSQNVIMLAPDGKKYTVDKIEVNEAVKNGWKPL